MNISDKDLIDAATAARENAYCRYSGYAVGAAIIDDNGRLHTGCNIENAAYPLGNCAEAAAIAAMVLEGGNRIVRIAVVGGSGGIGPCTPCGGCRQRIHEFANDDTVIITMDDSKDWQQYSIEELLPASFHLP
ncbi:MAG: cytidine deaminase [Gammaproteobacteria bacterium]|nr:cytidine deaminase [Gammaproteobacteria bacterium]